MSIFLLDGTAFIYRSYFAFINNPLRDKAGNNTSAIYGTVSAFLKLINRFQPEKVVVSFDLKDKTFRHKLDSNYKANRPPAPDELISQIEPIKKYFELCDVPVVTKAGFEADDVLGTLAEYYKKNDEVFLITGDKDYAQLVDDNVVMYDPFKDIEYTKEKVYEKYGVSTEQFIDYLALVGDSADNIPGVKGIGKVQAQKLLEKYDSLENIYNNVERLTKSQQKKFIENQDNAFLSQKLAKIIRDIPIDYEKIDPKFNLNSLKKANDLLLKYDLKSLVKRINKLKFPEIISEEKDVEDNENSYDDSETDLFSLMIDENYEEETSTENNELFKAICVDSDEEFTKFLAKIENYDEIVLNTVNEGNNANSAELIGLSICFDSEKSYYFPFAHLMEKNLNKEATLKKLKGKLANKFIISHNFKFDLIMLNRHNFDLKGNIFDTMIASYVLNPGDMKHKLADCVEREFDYQLEPISNLLGKGKKQISIDQVSKNEATKFFTKNSYFTLKLKKNYKKELQKNSLFKIFSDIEIPLIKALVKMEENGVYVDKNILKNISQKIQSRLSELVKLIYEAAGKQFNINSPQQLSKILFEDLGITPTKKIKTGYSTDTSVLEVLQSEYKIAKYLLEYRKISKLQSTYVNALPELIIEKTGRIHSSFNQTIASTGRLSSSNPNLQNIPIRSVLGREIRKAFVPQNENWSIIAADYSQIELRILAIFSQDQNLIKIFNEGGDIHSQTAAIMLNKPIEEISSNERRHAKVVNFGIIYGMGSRKLAKDLGITVKEAKLFIENYFEKFPTIKKYMDDKIQTAREKGYAETLFGRKLYLPDLSSSNNRYQKAAERVAVNMPIQGTAADIIKIAMIRINERIKNNKNILMIIQVHDELVFEVKNDFVEDAQKIIAEEMENILTDSPVKLSVDIGIGKSWFEAH